MQPNMLQQENKQACKSDQFMHFETTGFRDNGANQQFWLAVSKLNSDVEFLEFLEFQARNFVPLLAILSLHPTLQFNRLLFVF